jgi:hypothetical protein
MAETPTWETVEAAFEKCADDATIERMPVPGGWIYRIPSTTTVFFVPAERAAGPKGADE